ncbi:MAG: CopD family protein, partial [Luteimonas sp.]|nr:CopD family protein [Luteimonas sp.]
EQIAAVHRVLATFSAAGVVIVGSLVFSGVVNGWFIVGPDVLTLGKSTYGQLLLIKLGLFAVMLALAATHRFRMVPALTGASEHDATAALIRLRTSIAIEAGLGIGILGLVAWLGLLEPADVY